MCRKMYHIIKIGGVEMIRIDIPQRGIIELHHAVFDVNGTLAVDGIPIPGVGDRLQVLAEHLSLHVIATGEEKLRYVERLGPAGVIAFGNGRNDVAMLHLAAIGIAILAGEGVAIEALQAADVLAPGPVEAIDLVLKPKRLIATLRG